jgi:S-DNA-T family DNA segregation ATPase FtsK/SpoIIIE
MASTKKNVQSKKRGRPPKQQPKKQTGKQTRQKYDNKIFQEAVILVLLAFCVIFFISNFGIGGVVGKAISSFFFGLFGLISYIFPILLFLMVMFGISNKNNSVARIKIIAAVFALIFICTIIQLISGNHAGEWKISDYYVQSSHNKNGGGFFGGIFCKLFCTWFGVVGAYIFTIVLIIIAGVVITEHSFINGVKKGSRKVYDTAKNDVKEYRAEVAVKRQEREAVERKKSTRQGKNFRCVTIPPVGEEGAEPETPDKKEKVYNFEKAEDKNVVPFDEAEYEKVTDATEYAMRHFQDEQSIPFEPVYEDEVVEEYVEKPETKPSVKEEKPKKASAPEPEAFPVHVDVSRDSIKETVRDIHKAAKETEDEESLIDIDLVKKELEKERPNKKYKLPPIHLLKRGGGQGQNGNDMTELNNTARKLQQTLATFGVKVTVTDVSRGPAVTRYELQPEQGVKVSKIVSLTDDIKLNLAAADIRIEAPIPGKAAVGIEVPNKENSGVLLGDLIASRSFKEHQSKISFAAGKDIAGQTVIADIAKMPHLLIAGATGSGKSVCINTIIMSILYHASPEDVKLIMIDPKVVELNVYNGIPHLLIPVVTDPKKAAGALNWAVQEMMKRYDLFAKYGVRDMKGFNEKVSSVSEIEDPTKPDKLPQIVIIVDELADLMMVASGEVEDAIVRLAQLARAAGIHLVIATQRPSVNVITGLIKANVPSRIAFSVTSGVDSRTILDMVGAEKLLGKGDMLFYPQGYQKPSRVQGAFVSDEEVAAVVDFLKNNNGESAYSEEVVTQISNPGFEESQAFSGERDQYFADAGRFIIEKERASIGMLQRVFKIGFNRAARIMDQLGEAGIVGPEEGTKPRKVLMTMEEFEDYLNNNQ